MSDQQDTAHLELDAMRSIADALNGLDQEAIERVLRWVREKYRVSGQRFEPGMTQAAQSAGSEARFSDPASIVAAANPQTGTERALVVGYYFQVIEGQTDLDAQAINRELKHMGYGLTNVTNTLSSLMNQKPQLVIQTRKTGTSFQSRKRYRLTHEGIQRVRQLLGGKEIVSTDLPVD